MGRNAARRFQKEINEIVQDNVLPAALEKDHYQDAKSYQEILQEVMVEYFTQPAEHEIQNLHLSAAPTNLDNGLKNNEWETLSTLFQDVCEAGDWW